MPGVPVQHPLLHTTRCTLLLGARDIICPTILVRLVKVVVDFWVHVWV